MSTSTIIAPDGIRWLTEKLGDSTGRVFEYQQKICRAIYPEGLLRVQELLQRGILAELTRGGWLVPTTVSELTLEGFPMVLEHQRAPFYTAGFEWPASLLRDAALAWVEMNLALVPHQRVAGRHPGPRQGPLHRLIGQRTGGGRSAAGTIAR